MPVSLGIEVIHSPLLFASRLITGNAAVVIVDIFRAGTTICSAFQNGAEKVIPVASLEKAQFFKEKGFLVAGERNGIRLEFADYGNSPVEVSQANLKGKTLVITSTNGTQSIEIAKSEGMVAIGAFTNLRYIAEWLLTLKKNIIILCSGWQDSVSLEDSLYAGALTSELMNGNRSLEMTDSAFLSIDLWNSVKTDIGTYVQRGSHYQRLVKIGMQKDLDFAMRIDSTKVIPLYENYYLTNILK
jgi:2-phosphosulfolactate phosphatase